MVGSHTTLISADVEGQQQYGRWTAWTAVMMIASMATLVQSYVAIKLFFVVLFLFSVLVNIYRGRTKITFYRRLVWFYVWIGLAGVVWALIGLLHPANHVQGVFDALKLYVVWSAAFIVLYILLRAGPSLLIVHRAIVVSGILISVMNFIGLYDQYSGSGLISDSIRQELDMNIGLGDGYIQITSQNIDVMFLIAPYLVALQFRKDSGKLNSPLTKLALALSLILVVASGRRALWLVVALMPFTMLLLSWLTFGYGLLKVVGRRFLLVCAAASVVALGALFIVPENRLDVGSVSRFREAFSSEDYRTIQKPYLIEGFLRSPVVGSGFGAAARYIRDDERPWAGYELTYYQMLFNLGIVGVTALSLLFSSYLIKVIRLSRQYKNGSTVPFALLVGYCSFFMGAYSNRYFGSFDLLFFVGLLPFLSTFERGFDWPQTKAGMAV